MRRHCLLLSFDPIRALLLSDRLLLVVPDGADSLLQTLADYMQLWKEDHSAQRAQPAQPAQRESVIAFELHALEAMMMTAASIHSQEFLALRGEVDAVLQLVKDAAAAVLPVDKQESMRRLKNAASVMSSRVRSRKRALEDLPEEDEVIKIFIMIMKLIAQVITSGIENLHQQFFTILFIRFQP